MKSRWTVTDEDVRNEAERKAEKAAKKLAKAKKKRLQDEAAAQSVALAKPHSLTSDFTHPAKRQKLTDSPPPLPSRGTTTLLRFPAPTWQPSRHIESFERLNAIEEGSYGYVTRGRDSNSGEIVALKRLKADNAEGIPVTGLREITILKECKSPNIVNLREVVVGGDEGEDVYLVMDFVEHDLKTILESQPDPFLPSEIKTLMQQLMRGIDYLHKNYIIHRDLKTSNVLLSNRGQLQIADFGMARYTSTPPPSNLTQLVVTLWYRSPELLLGAETYGFEVDMWSVGCIFGELLAREPLLPGKNEVDELAKIFELCGVPTSESWPGFRRLKNAKSLKLPNPQPHNLFALLRARYPSLTNSGTGLLSSLLSLNPSARPSASEVLKHVYFIEDPKPKPAAMFPTFPSKAGQEKVRRRASPNAPKRAAEAPAFGAGDFAGIFAGRETEAVGGGFALRMG